MKDKTVRLFESDFLEWFTRVHPIVPLFFWSPVIIFLLWHATEVNSLSVEQISAFILPGVLAWSFSEYCIHRFLFHYPARSDIGKRLVYLFHGVHHDVPNDKRRLVMPPAGGVLVMSILWFLFSLVIPSPWIEPFFAFFIMGYLIYDYLHYATHFFKMKSAPMASLTRHHLRHHFTSEDAYFGVSSPLWDWVFRTLK